jgi:hypothetical protein
MNVIVCVDNELGMMFNNRRQSRDIKACEDMLKLSGGNLVIAPYSEKLFTELSGYRIVDDPLGEAVSGEYVLIEDRGLLEYVNKIEKIVLYHWNRDYPSDKKLDTPPTQHGFHLVDSYEFEGRSHEKITREIYER